MDSKSENALVFRIRQLEERLDDSFGEIHSLQVQNSLLKREIQEYKFNGVVSSDEEMPDVVSSDEEMPDVAEYMINLANEKAKIDNDAIKLLSENMYRLETANNELKKKAKVDKDAIKLLTENMYRLETANNKLNKKQRDYLEKKETDYGQAQHAISILKSSIYNILKTTTNMAGLRNVDIARQLGIRGGIGPHHDIRHRDWISKTILSIMERDEVAEQIGTRWFLKSHERSFGM